VEQLQQAIFRYAVSGSAPEQQAPLPTLLKFDLEGHAIMSCLLEGMGHDEGSVSPHNNQKPQESVHVLDWRRTSKDPFAGQWEQILFWVQTNPTRSGGNIFRELQSLFPGRYRTQHLRTLQRGLRRIRAYVLTTREEPQQTEVIHAEVRPPHDTALASTAIVSLPSRPMQSVAPSSRETSTHSSHHYLTAQEPAIHPLGKATHLRVHPPTLAESASSQAVQPPHITRASAKQESRAPSLRRVHHLTIARAIQSYLQAHRKARHRPKTLEWHQTVLHQLQDYLLLERHLLHVSQITETDLGAWIASVGQTPTPAGRGRSPSTIETYARSVRAFCAWLVHQGMLPCSSMSEGSFPRASLPFPHVVSPETFDQFVQASCPLESKALTTIGWGLPPPLHPHDEEIFSLAEHLRQTGALFIAAHEYSHILLGHVQPSNANEGRSRHDGPESKTWKQELDADWLACGILDAVLTARRLPPPVQFMGVHFFFISAMIVDLALTALQSGQSQQLMNLIKSAEQQPGTTHPVPVLRGANVNLWLQKKYPPLEYRATQYFAALLLQVADSLWVNVEPHVLNMRSKGFNPPVNWTGFDVFEHD